MKSYNKKMLSIMTDPDLIKIYDEVRYFSGREYNRKVSGYILDEFLDRMSDEDSLHFLQYMPTFLSGLQSGMFDTIARWLETITFSETLEPLKRELINCLRDADEVKEVPTNSNNEVIEPDSKTQSEPESEDETEDVRVTDEPEGESET